MTAPSVNTSASKPVGCLRKTTPNPSAPIKQVNVEPQQQTPTQPSARADDTQRTRELDRSVRRRLLKQADLYGKRPTKKIKGPDKDVQTGTLSAPALDALYQRANSAVRAGRYNECIKAFERWMRSAGRKHPDFSTAQGRLIYCKTKALR